MCRAIEIMINETVCETERAKAIKVVKYALFSAFCFLDGKVRKEKSWILMTNVIQY